MNTDDQNDGAGRQVLGGRQGVTVRPDVHARFRRVLQRGIARADAEIAEHHARIARIAALQKLPRASRERIGELLRLGGRRP